MMTEHEIKLLKNIAAARVSDGLWSYDKFTTYTPEQWQRIGKLTSENHTLNTIVMKNLTIDENWYGDLS